MTNSVQGDGVAERVVVFQIILRVLVALAGVVLFFVFGAVFIFGAEILAGISGGNGEPLSNSARVTVLAAPALFLLGALTVLIRYKWVLHIVALLFGLITAAIFFFPSLLSFGTSLAALPLLLFFALWYGFFAVELIVLKKRGAT